METEFSVQTNYLKEVNTNENSTEIQYSFEDASCSHNKN